MLNDEEGPAGEEPVLAQVDEVKAEVEDHAGKDRGEDRVRAGKEVDEEIELHRMKDADTGIGDVVLHFLELLQHATVWPASLAGELESDARRVLKQLDTDPRVKDIWLR